MSTPDVSVITPTYRREKEVLEAIQSVLAQAGVSVEMFVLDDTAEGTARAAVEGLGDPRVHYVQRAVPSGGKPALVRNEGIQLARGRYVYFLDDDDRVIPGALGALVRMLDCHPERGVAFGRVEAFGPDEGIVARYRRWWEWAGRTARRTESSWLTVGIILFRGTPIINSTCIMRRSCALQLGGYDSGIPLYEDVDFFMRGIRRFGHLFVDVPVLHYRTGRPSLIHNLKGDKTPISESYRIIHDKYKAEHGRVEYAALQLISKLLPIEHPPVS